MYFTDEIHPIYIKNLSYEYLQDKKNLNLVEAILQILILISLII